MDDLGIFDWRQMDQLRLIYQLRAYQLSVVLLMLMSLFRWEAKVLNQIYKTDRYQKLAELDLRVPEQIDYKLFYELTPETQCQKNQKQAVIRSVNNLCRPNTSADIMKSDVLYLHKYYNDQLQGDGQAYTLEHVMIYSTLSKCRIWPKILKVGGDKFVPELIRFYNGFTHKYSDYLSFKFDPIILSQKYTKIMNKVNSRKRDHPQLVGALKADNIEQVRAILQQMKADAQKQAAEGAEQGITQSAEQLLAENINSIMHKGKLLTHLAVIHSSIPIMRELYELGADFEGTDDEDQTAIFYSVKRNDLKVIEFLVKEVKVNINHREYQMRTPLYLAAFEGYVDVIEFLYDNGADPELCSKLDRTPLSKACYLGNVEAVKFLLSKKVDILKRDNKGRTALHNAVWGIEGGRQGKRRGSIILEDSPECAELIIQAGHPLEFKDADGFTPLFSAVSSMALKSIQLLRKYGANFHGETVRNENCSFIAAKYGHLPVLRKLIEEYGCTYLKKDIEGYSPLCASITLPSSATFFYLADKYVQTNNPLEIHNLLRCCIAYETIANFQYVADWVASSTSREQKLSKIKIIIKDTEGLLKILQEIQNRGSLNIVNQAAKIDALLMEEEESTDWDPTDPAQKSSKIPSHFYPKSSEPYSKKAESKNKGIILRTILQLSKQILEYQPASLPAEELDKIISQCVSFFNRHPSSSCPKLAAGLVSIAEAYKIPLNGLEIKSYHSEADILDFMFCGRTNLTENSQQIWKALMSLCLYRKTALIVSMFNQIQSNNARNFPINWEKLRQIIKHKPEGKLSMIQYCLSSGIGDIAVYLSSVVEQEITLSVSIYDYTIHSTRLTDKQTEFVLQTVDPWVTNLEEVFNKKMSAQERQIYNIFLQKADLPNDQSLFVPTGSYQMVETLEKLEELRKEVEKSTLIGIDVEHYNPGGSQYFACSIQVAVSSGVFILDPLAVANGQDLTPAHIGEFIRQLLKDGDKIKILHAYENDLKWLNEDYGIDSLKNVVDTNRIEQCRKDKKNMSIGLKKLAEVYLNYKMSKDFQRSDWRIRPLFKEMIQYAAIDAEILPFIYVALLKNTADIPKLATSLAQKKVFRSRNVRNTIVAPAEKMTMIESHE